MIIGISLNEVLRDFLSQFTYTYNKYIGVSTIKEGDVKSTNLIEYFPFKTIDDLNRFMYFEETLEIFGHADQTHDGIMNQFNNYYEEIKDFGEHKIVIVSKEINKSIPSTLFFLSKLGCRAEEYRFVQDYADKWKDVDMLITANPTALEAKPAGKISVKVKASYNENTKADFTIDSLIDFIKDRSIRDSIFNTKITTYEELK